MSRRSVSILQQEVTYVARGGMKKIETITLIRRKIKGFRGEEFCRQSKKINLTVPSVPPTSFQPAVCVFKYMLRVANNMFIDN